MPSTRTIFFSIEFLAQWKRADPLEWVGKVKKYFKCPWMEEQKRLAFQSVQEGKQILFIN